MSQMPHITPFHTYIGKNWQELARLFYLIRIEKEQILFDSSGCTICEPFCFKLTSNLCRRLEQFGQISIENHETIDKVVG